LKYFSRFTAALLVTTVIFAMIATAEAADWPAFRHDAARTNISPESLPDGLHLQWKRQLPPVKPAFRKARLQFDAGYEPIVAGNALYVAQPHIDAVVAYAVDTGAEQWRFHADGPVRLAPVAWEDKIFFGSDDGNLYCLNAADGTMQWKFRAVPSKRKILGNGRLISVWPLRGGPVIADGTIYFAAGVWPLEGVFVYALDATSGQMRWVNDRCGALYGRNPHQGRAIAGLSPQGYLVVNGDDLVVPCGSARPATFNRHTGELINFTLPGEGRAPGGWFMMADTQDAKDIRRGKVQFDKAVNSELHEGGVYTGDGVPGLRTQITLGEKSLKYADGLDGVDGAIHAMLMANGRLFVVTLEGAIYAFASGEVEPKLHKSMPVATEVTALDPALSKQLEAANIRSGYALVLGTKSGDVVRQLAAHTELNVLASAPNVADADALRRQFGAAGIPNTRVAILSGPLEELGLPPYIADLMVAEDWSGTGFGTGPEYVVGLYERLRPYGGTACLEIDSCKDEEVRAALDGVGHTEATLERLGALLLMRREGALPGSVDYTKDWTAPDALVRAPLGMLWFDDAIAHFKRSPQPHIVGGIMVSQDKEWTGDTVSAGPANRLHEDGTGRFLLGDARFMDVYTGRVLSSAEAESRMENIPVSPGNETRAAYQFRPPYVDAYYAGHVAKGTQPGKWPFLLELEKGEMVNPISGTTERRRYVKSYGCDGGVDYGHLITMRSATPAFYDKRVESGTINISGPRSGCTNSIIPANGVLNMPFFYDGCVCSYPLPTGAALVTMPQTFEQWTAWGPGKVGPMARIGINLGAPGDRMTNEGTLFVDYPSVGGPSPEISVTTEPEAPNYFYHHALFTKGGNGWPWVSASGAEGLTSIRISGLKPGTFTVRLYFMEPKHADVGARVFDVTLQGKTLLKDFDIVADAGGRMKSAIKEFADIAVDGSCEVTLKASAGVTLLSGIELVSTELPLDEIVVAWKMAR
jgi:outer membrane protein assembly factor BamB